MQNIDYSKYIKLPVKTLSKTNSPGAVVEIRTPHKGVILIETMQTRSGMFSAPSEISRTAKSIVYELVELENEAKDFLLDQWLLHR